MSSTTALPARAQRRAERIARVQYLVTADESSLLQLETYLATLPLCATGRVFIEVPDASWISAVSAPSRMTVSWLPRNERFTDSGVKCARGTAVARAACAWTDEMFCEEQAQTNLVLLGGFLGTADIVDHLREANKLAFANVTVPERFGQLLELAG